MSTEITNLDELVGKPKKAQLDGKVYTLPAEIPVPLYLEIKAAEKAANEGGDFDPIESVHDQCLELFQVHQPDLKVLPVGLVQLFQIIPAIYGGGDGEESDGEDPPRRTRARPGSGSGTSRKASRSRS